MSTAFITVVQPYPEEKLKEIINKESLLMKGKRTYSRLCKERVWMVFCQNNYHLYFSPKFRFELVYLSVIEPVYDKRGLTTWRHFSEKGTLWCHCYLLFLFPASLSFVNNVIFWWRIWSFFLKYGRGLLTFYILTKERNFWYLYLTEDPFCHTLAQFLTLVILFNQT